MKTNIVIVLIMLLTSSGYCQEETIKEASIDFLSTLNRSEKDSLTFKFEDLNRTEWTNLPIGLANRPGLKYGALSVESKIKFHNLLLTIFSSQGYLKTTHIMHLDGLLLNIYEVAHAVGDVNEEDIQFIRTLNWGQGNYFISIWGNPSKQDKWAMKAVGSSCYLFLYEGQKHGFFNYDNSKVYYRKTTFEADKFLNSLGYLEGEPTIMNKE